MSPKKLTEDDKKEILDLYRQTAQTTSTLAEQFGVSSSTISRFLKMSLSGNEYEVLIQQKRLARVSKADSQLSLVLENSGDLDSIADTEPLAIATENLPAPSSLEIIAVVKSTVSEEIVPVANESVIQVKTRKRRSTATSELPTETVAEFSPDTTSIDSGIPVEDPPLIEKATDKKIIKKITLKSDIAKNIDLFSDQSVQSTQATPSEIAENLPLMPSSLNGTDLGELVKELGKLPKIAPDLEEIEDDLDDDLDDEEEEDWDEAEETSFIPSLNSSENLTVLPLSAAKFPAICYLVIDRTAELIVRPLKEFAHLGKIPPEEVQQKTLPVFDNHRVARRFSNRTQRVIKVPDSSVLRKTSSHLKAKGITRIFLDGQVYSLAN